MAEWYTADLECTTDENDCRVWAWSSVNIYSPDTTFVYGTDFKDLFNYMFSKYHSVWYFRNLKYDGEFILSYLFNNGYEWRKGRKKEDKTFNTLISDKGQFYCIRIHDNNNTVEIRDSLKIVTLSISETAKAFGLKETKLKIDYHKYRPPGYQLTTEEIEYIKNDVVIDAKSLIYFFNQGLTKMTKGSDALFFFQENIFGGKKNFRRRFPEITKEDDEYLRKAYKGGYVYANKVHKGEWVGEGLVVDNNSLFPHQMRNKKMPYGQPKYYTGEYKTNKLYDLYVCHIQCQFKLKPNKLPTIQIKHTLAFQENEYLESSNLDIVNLWLTSWDLELFLEHYYVSNLTYVDGYMFKSKNHKELVDYIDYWGSIKIEAGKTGNKGLRTLAKFMLNCLYGKFGLSIETASKIPYLDEDTGIVKYRIGEKETRDGVYLPLALFVTAGGRVDTITSAQKIKDYSIKNMGEDLYYYSDTDSIHTGITDLETLSEIIRIDDFEIGKWAVESHFTKAIFLRQKCYVEEIEGKLCPTVAGLPKQMHDLVTEDNFKYGTKYMRKEEDCIPDSGQGTKKRFKHVKGGVVLVDTHFTIKG